MPVFGLAVLGRLLRKILFPVLLKKLSSKSGALENRLNEVVLLQRLREVLVHLGLDALFTITHHGVSRQGNDRRSVRALGLLILANLAGGLETTLVDKC